MKGKNQYNKVTTETIIERFKEVHGGRYNYSKVRYINMNTPVCIICPIHGEFWQNPHNHERGATCPECAKIRIANKNRITYEEFIKRAKEKHGNKYNYSKVVYVNNRTKICIICPIHGEFWQKPSEHLRGSGCRKCADEYTSNLIKERYKLVFKERADKIHNFKYIYNVEDYKGNEEKMRIFCPIHGEFWQTPHEHLSGCGCPKCGIAKSKCEEDIKYFLQSLNLSVLSRNREIIKPQELDIYIPDKNIAIEYDGLIWHSEKFSKDKYYHLKKTEECNKLGIRLIHIFEDEWLEKENIVKSMLSNILGYNSNKIYARKCEIKEIGSEIAFPFLDENHIQGKCKAKYYIGLYYQNELVSLMTFGKTRQMKKYNNDYDNTWELLRFCSKLNTTVIGGASKLLKYFIKKYNPKQIITYADKRWSNGNLYNKLGFVHTHDSKPNYYYVIGQKRENRFKYRKGELVKKGFDKNKSEHQIMIENGMYRIYDCGAMCFKMKL